MKPKVCVMKARGTNCERETARAFEIANAAAEVVLVSELLRGSANLSDYQILVIPGGFSYGDDLSCGKVLAVELLTNLKEPLANFVAKGGLVLGICNGFQVLVKAGLLPFGEIGNIQATLTDNDISHFWCDWVTMKVEKSPCVFTKGLEGTEVSYQVAHGEGKVFTNPEVLQRVESEGLVVFRYTKDGAATTDYPENPNGSLNSIAGLCDPSGRIMGLMPHPERFVEDSQYANWRRSDVSPLGRAIFENAVRAVG